MAVLRTLHWWELSVGRTTQFLLWWWAHKTTWELGEWGKSLTDIQNNYSLFILRFKSNYFESGMGFHLRYESTDQVPKWTYRMGEPGVCGGTFSLPYGIFTSPSYPHNYPDNADCVYSISQPTGNAITLKFLNFYTQKYFGTCYDYLEVRDGPSETSPLLDKLCGSAIPVPIQSNKNQLWLRWSLLTSS